MVYVYDNENCLNDKWNNDKFKMIEEIPVLTDVQIKYYEEILKSRATPPRMLAGNLQNNRTKGRIYFK